MMDETVSRVRIPQILDAVTYVSVGAMSLLGISGLPGLQLRLMALGLVLAFVVLYRSVFRSGRYERNPALYFGVQVTILSLLFLLGSDNSDAFNFLFIILCVHIAVVSPARLAVPWIAFCFGVVSAIILVTRGTDGFYAILFYSVTFIVSGFFGGILRQAELARDRNQRLLEELQATQKKLQELAVLEERNRLARDLHDSVKQQVFAISMQLSAARISLQESDPAYSSVVQAEKLAQQAGAELTTLIHQLRPPGLERKSLSEAIKEHVNEWKRQNNMETETDIGNFSVNLNVEQTLFRVLQEALANVARHSQATKARIALTSENDHVVLTVEDNGMGYDALRVAKGIGLDSMRERLAAVDGSLEISTLPSQGTRVTAVVRRS